MDWISFELIRLEDWSLVFDDGELEKGKVDWLGNKGSEVLVIGEEIELTGVGLDLVELESIGDIVLGVGLGAFADIRVEPEDDKKDVIMASVLVCWETSADGDSTFELNIGVWDWLLSMECVGVLEPIVFEVVL